jgi:Ca-activated chloride channel family protein
MLTPMRRLAALTLALCLTTLPARACEVALLFAIDVSGSVDPGEYRLQIDGLSAALRDPAIADALETGQVALKVVQWSGLDQQQVSIPWTRMRTRADIDGFATQATRLPRAFARSDTAVGELLHFAAAQFGPVADCRRRVIDVSGDGPTNVGRPSGPASAIAARDGIEINAIAIEMMGRSMAVTEYYRRMVITRPSGFVMTARGHEDYPDTLRAKIFRELVQPLG